jgi:hypothetical protein
VGYAYYLDRRFVVPSDGVEIVGGNSMLSLKGGCVQMAENVGLLHDRPAGSEWSERRFQNRSS